MLLSSSLSQLLGLFGLGSANLKWLLIVLLVGMGIGGYTGYKLTSNSYLAAEVRLRKETDKKIEQVEEAHRRALEDFLERQTTLEELVERLGDEASKDPNANRPAISRDGVRRIDSVR